MSRHLHKLGIRQWLHTPCSLAGLPVGRGGGTCASPPYRHPSLHTTKADPWSTTSAFTPGCCEPRVTIVQVFAHVVRQFGSMASSGCQQSVVAVQQWSRKQSALHHIRVGQCFQRSTKLVQSDHVEMDRKGSGAALTGRWTAVPGACLVRAMQSVGLSTHWVVLG